MVAVEFSVPDVGRLIALGAVARSRIGCVEIVHCPFQFNPRSQSPWCWVEIVNSL